MRRLAPLGGLVGLVVVVLACGSGDAAAALKGTQANVTVYYGCDCFFPAAGSIEVIVSPPEGVTLLDAEVSGEGWPRDFSLTLAPNDGALTCDSQTLTGFGGADYAGFDNELPTIESVVPDTVHLRLHYRADGEDEWAEVPVTSACVLPAYGL